MTHSNKGLEVSSFQVYIYAMIKFVWILVLGALMVPTGSFAYMVRRHRYVRVNPHHFVVRNPELWRHGRWYHGLYDGAFGWWWMVGTTWYFYDRPVYPYPAVTFAPTYTVEVPPSETQSVVVIPAPAQVATTPALGAPNAPTPAQVGQAPLVSVAPAPSQVARAPGPAPAPAWYYCSQPAGYYPTVPACPSGWTAVPATPSH